MITKLPTDLAPGDRLATYDVRWNPAPPITVLRVDDLSASFGVVMVDTTGASFRMRADTPVEMAP